MNIFEGTLELKSPLTKECWDKLADVELENTERIWFTTPSEKRVEYIKADVLNKIRADVINIADGRRSIPVRSVINILDKYKEESEADNGNDA